MGSRSEQSGQRGKWIRTGCLQTDMLKAFECGDMHDCTIRVGCNLNNPQASYKDFKCHKFVLSLASDVFERMFFCNFKEAKMYLDDPIPLDKTDPEVFEYAMRCVYGGRVEVSNSKSTPFVIKVYKLALQLRINALKEPLTDLLSRPSCLNVFTIFDLFCASDNQKGLDICKSVLASGSTSALYSDAWPRIGLESVQEFMRMHCMQVKEVELVRALVRWARFQVHSDGDALDGQNLRSKMGSCLNLIRFSALTAKEFASLCLEELRTVLSMEEQHSIMMAIATEDWSLMPPHIAPSILAASRNKSKFAVCHVPFEHFFVKRQTPFLNSFCLMVQKKVKLVGLALKFKLNPHIVSTFELKKGKDGDAVWKGSSKSNRISHNGEEFYTISPSLDLDAGIDYVMTISMPLAGRFDAYKIKPFKVEILPSKEVNVEIFGYDDFCILEALLFETNNE